MKIPRLNMQDLVGCVEKLQREQGRLAKEMQTEGISPLKLEMTKIAFNETAKVLKNMKVS